MLEYRQRIIEKFGEHDVFKWRKIHLHPLAPKEVFVQIDFIGVNFADIIARKGWYKWAGKPPVCVGFEYSGTVIEKGPNVSSLKIGDKVFGISKFNAYAEAIYTQEDLLWKIPSFLSPEQAAAFPAVYLTAYHCLTEVMRIRKEDDILIHAVAGGVGIAALQIAKSFGLKTYGTASSDQKINFAKKYQLDHGINYRKADFEKEIKQLSPDGIKFVLDSIGGNTLQKGYRCLKASGHLVSIGGADLLPIKSLDPLSFIKNVKKASWIFFKNTFRPFQLIEHNKGISGVQVLLLWDHQDKLQSHIKNLLKLFHEKSIETPHVDQIFSLEKAYEAHRYIESRKSKGKILLATKPS